MNVTSATDFITTNKGAMIVVRLTDGMTAFGEAFSVNSKGVNIKTDGKVRSIALSRIDGLELDNLGDDDELALDDMDIEAQLHDDMTTSELADLMGTTPKALRVSLRALGMGVGKGRKYSLHATAYNLVKAHVDANN
jgi:hypothetical protein